ncbi:MAG: histone deacetylase [Candidatus Brocadiia bacterium]
MPEPKFIYLPGYYCDIGEHVFRTEKYELLYERMVEEGVVGADDFVEPEPASREQLELVHEPAYLDDLFSYRHTTRTISSEMPISKGIIEAFILGAGGSLLAARLAAQQETMTMNLAGGFHHAFPAKAEGFCYINDVAVAAANALEEGVAERILIVDCDLHQGNGTAYIFRGNPAVFTFSIHQENNYPLKRQSDCDTGLDDYCSGEGYLQALEANVIPAFENHDPDLVFYVAGADPYEKDQLGSLMLSIKDLRQRDDLVLGECSKRQLPVAVMLAGGYAPDLNDTVKIHYGTVCAVTENAGRLGEK